MMTNNINNHSLQNSNSGNQNNTSIYNTGTFKNVTYYGESHKLSGDEGARWKLLSAVVGIISAVIIAFGPALVKDDATAAENSKPISTQAESKSPSSHETSPATTMPHPTETNSKGTEDPADDSSTGTSIPQSYKPDKIKVTMNDHWISGGDKIGPNKFHIRGGATYIELAYTWEAKNGDFVIESDNCEMVIKVSGPASVPGDRSSLCSTSNSGQSYLKFTAPGDYTITVTDKQSNASGELKISIVR